MKIQFYMTSDCPKCEIFWKNLKEAIIELDLDEEIERIDVELARKMGIRSCPALIINDDLKSSGILLSVEELKNLLQENL